MKWIKLFKYLHDLTKRGDYLIQSSRKVNFQIICIIRKNVPFEKENLKIPNLVVMNIFKKVAKPSSA